MGDGRNRATCRRVDHQAGHQAGHKALALPMITIAHTLRKTKAESPMGSGTLSLAPVPLRLSRSCSVAAIMTTNNAGLRKCDGKIARMKDSHEQTASDVPGPDTMDHTEEPLPIQLPTCRPM